MANRKSSDPQKHVPCSGVRSGLKRELAFALKSQRELPNSRGRTRSCKASVVVPAAPPFCGGKKPKRSDDREEKPAPFRYPEKTFIIALPAVISVKVDRFPAGRVAVDNPTADKGNEGNLKNGVGVPILTPSEEESEKDGISLDSPVLAEGKMGPKKDDISADKSTANYCKLTPEVKLKNSTTFIPSASLPLESLAVDSEVSSSPLKNELASEHSVVFDGISCSKIDNCLAERRIRRFTRSALKLMPAISSPIRTEEGNIGEVKLKRRFTRSDLKSMIPATATSFTIEQDNTGEVNPAALSLRTNQQENLVKVPIIIDNCRGVDVENHQLDESIEVGLEGFVSVNLMSGLNKDNEMGAGVLLENSTTTSITVRRRKRTLLKSAIEESAVADASTPTIVESDESKGDNNTLNGSLSTMLKKKMELKMSKKITLTKLPSNIRELLGTGLLEGLPVKYTSCLGKNAGLQGVIRGNGILCLCTSCEGAIVLSAHQFEIHAGSTKKHPSDFIFLQNGKSIREVLKSCTGSSVDMLEAVIQKAIGPLLPKKLSVCQKCKGCYKHIMLDPACTKKFPLLCNSCLEQSHQQVIPTSSHGIARSAKLLRRVLVSVISDGTPVNLSFQKKPSYGKLTRKDLRLHKLVFMDDILPQGTEVGYYIRGKRLLEGYIKDSGIFCHCCSSVLSPSQFEAHASQASRRKPYNNIYTSNGVSLHELSVSLSKGRKFSATENDDLCGICADGGDLLLCDLCPRAFHKECVGLSNIPDGDWFCQYCQNLQHKDKCLAKNDNAIAAGRVAGVDPIEQIIKRCIRIVSAPENDAGVCALCRQHDFRRSGFDKRTVIICDQCEIEYHVGCLKDHGIADLKKLPQEEWFCRPECSSIHSSLHKLLCQGPEALEELDANIIRIKLDKKGLSKAAAADVRWRLLSGRSDSVDSKLLLSQALSIFRESFDPIVDPISGRDIIPFMVYGRNMRYQDYGGVYCMVLTQKSSVISAGLLRVLGCEVAELPLVATRRDSQGLGYFPSLFSCIERLLKSLKVKHFVLPAADDAVFMWTNKFGFKKLTQTQLLEHAKSTQPIVFQGTSILHKTVLGLPELPELPESYRQSS